MEFVLMHKPAGTSSPQALKLLMYIAKKMVTKPQELVPQGNLIASYYCMSEQVNICIWDVPSLEALLPMLKQMSMLGYNTDVLPVEKAEVAFPNLEKAMQDMQA